jgi:hypothetical protein
MSKPALEQLVHDVPKAIAKMREETRRTFEVLRRIATEHPTYSQSEIAQAAAAELGKHAATLEVYVSKEKGYVLGGRPATQIPPSRLEKRSYEKPPEHIPAPLETRVEVTAQPIDQKNQLPVTQFGIRAHAAYQNPTVSTYDIAALTAMSVDEVRAVLRPARDDDARHVEQCGNTRITWGLAAAIFKLDADKVPYSDIAKQLSISPLVAPRVLESEAVKYRRTLIALISDLTGETSSTPYNPHIQIGTKIKGISTQI